MSSTDWSGSNLPILRVYPFSSTDGPGNRYAIYLAGCNLNCKSCHNPESISICDSCGACVGACEFDALRILEGQVLYDPKQCTKCDRCIYTCDKLSSPKLVPLSDQDILADITKRRDFIRGVTFSGGEATLHYKRLIPLIKQIKALGLSVFIDTNGQFTIDSEFQAFVDVVDKFMLDIKFLDDQTHVEYTGVSNTTILQNLKILLDQNKIHEVRTVFYGTPDNSEEIKQIATLFPTDILYKIIPYHTHGVRTSYRSLFDIPSKEQLTKLHQHFQSTGRLYTIL